MLRLIVAWIVAVANAIAAAYIAVLMYMQIKNRVRTGEIKFCYGIGPVLVPIDIRSADGEGGDTDATS